MIGYMQGYIKSDSLVFVGKQVLRLAKKLRDLSASLS
jgi:hypothetical protein